MAALALLTNGLWWLSLAATLAGAVALARSRRTAPLAPLMAYAAAILLTLATLLDLRAGGWPDMGGRIFRASLALLATWLLVALPAFSPQWSGWWSGWFWQALARSGGFLHAGFFLALGAASLRNETPLPPTMAVQMLLLGCVLLLLPALAQRSATAGRRLSGWLAILLLGSMGVAASGLATPPQSVRPASAP
ncbi:hypothetical protein L6Q21_12945 [Sandaracinobacter sp. RS1-74]|uniref:hypothetical protein n=1 Tax=Sandaracinobacteroides sayramensis TaxID=2913411 RepID=UPI001EDC536D|nr:hypothetical protein [Sandaracinobacteroides sayramensis]MCG2841889.1 hypothetical protein [Sandaracinobacteroides sayramensis]